MKTNRVVLSTHILTLILSLPLSSPGAHAKGLISTIAVALGRDILDDFKLTTGLDVNLHIFSSRTSINRLKNGFCELAASTVRLTKEEREQGLIEIPICRDPLVVIIDCNL